jgi:5-(carboxyamino)imidazole ribonucleotide synthase
MASQSTSDLQHASVAGTYSTQRVGVIGGGQLAWMMAEGAQKLGVELVVQTPKPSDPAVAIAVDTVLAPVADAVATQRLAEQCDVITFENEFIDLLALTQLAQRGVRFFPQLEALKPLLDKYDQRRYMQAIGLPTPQFITLESEGDRAQLQQVQFPVVLKTRRHGYDGQGTFILQDLTSLETTWEHLGHQPILLEEFVPFEQELAVMVARSAQGEIVTYPIVVTEQEDQVCRRVFVPAHLNESVQTEVQAIAHTLMDRLQVVGIFGIELFLTADQRVLVNEIAPRTHNSGHYTLDACKTSQFEQQLRAVCGLTLGDPHLICAGAVMVNLLGFEHSHSDYAEKRDRLAQVPQAGVHWYGKTESRPGRKLGHVTVLLDDPAQAQVIAQQIEAIWYA